MKHIFRGVTQSRFGEKLWIFRCTAGPLPVAASVEIVLGSQTIFTLVTAFGDPAADVTSRIPDPAQFRRINQGAAGQTFQRQSDMPPETCLAISIWFAGSDVTLSNRVVTSCAGFHPGSKIFWSNHHPWRRKRVGLETLTELSPPAQVPMAAALVGC
ncbi:hypothetical protein ElyMa_000612300 [Elysia marginata]|uniref:Reelin domain-containing protein n=1 Tax=Elysia marginata TaxID=1093978 RepID=A0AAV4G9B4_9GAST|nr:hypothetical protein ElyMa_000612300 [Elysia marginata]